jgi:5-methyltetrahydrofolate corrinoid/iron sulfur protein methyltransferase
LGKVNCMIIVGERLNSNRKPVLQALEKKDKSFLLEEAIKQEQARANFIDLNAAALLDKEVEALKWAIPLLQEKLNIPLSIDTPNSVAMAEGLKIHRGRALLNSLSGEKKKINNLLPLIKEYKPMVIILCLDEKGFPQSPEYALSIASRMVDLVEREGIDLDDIFIDPLVHPVSIDPDAALLFLESLRRIKERMPKVKIIAGLSNISFGLPQRRLLNRVFLSIAILNGLDAAILNPLDAKLLHTISTTEGLLGKEPSLQNYLRIEKKEK